MIKNEIENIVTPDDFKNFTGQDLRALLGTQDNESNYPYIFLGLIQEFLINWCDENGFRRIPFNNLNEERKNNLKKAICFHALYTIKNGYLGLGLDSGYNSEKGIIADINQLRGIEVPTIVISLLHKSGLFNLKLKNRQRYTRGYPWITGGNGQDY